MSCYFLVKKERWQTRFCRGTAKVKINTVKGSKIEQIPLGLCLGPHRTTPQSSPGVEFEGLEDNELVIIIINNKIIISKIYSNRKLLR